MASKPSLNNPLVVQKQIRENATEVQNFLSDLSNWSTEMKAKEMAESPSDINLTPLENLPLRNDPNPKKSKPNANETTQAKSGKNGKKVQTDYSGWEKFDAEKACEEVETKDKKAMTKAESYDEAAKRRAIEMRLQKMSNDKKALGNQCLKEKDYAKAVEYYTEGIRCDRKGAVLYANRAQAYIFLKQYDKAVDDCTESIKNDVAYIKAYYRRAKARFEMGKLQEAKNDLNQALRLQPGNIEAKQLLNEIHSKTMKSLLGPTSKFGEVTPGRKNEPKQSLFPGIQTKLVSQAANRVLDRFMDDDDDSGGGGDAEVINEQYPKSIAAIIKPEERRSKRPLLPIHVKIVGDEGKRMRLDYNGNEGSNSSSVSASNTSSGVNTPVVVPSSPLSNPANLSSPPSSLPNLFSQLKMTTIPSKPKTAAQFTIDWKKLKAYPDMCANYLKQMNADDYLIFQDSMEYSILTDILDLLVWEFLPPKWDFVTHLKGLLKVRRFSTLVMFMTEKDRANARKLISECPEECQEEFKTKYKV